MLFRRLYNWIKYKTTPISFLFKNRLFIERDSKHKRIYTVLGIIFRNSKWGNFELANIKHQFRFRYLKYLKKLILFLLFLLFLLIYTNYINKTYFLSSVIFAGWLSIDAFDYYFSFVLWAIMIIISISINWIQSYFLETLTFLPATPQKNNFDYFFDPFTKRDDIDKTQLYINKHELKYLFYHWLYQTKDIQQNQYFDQLFDIDLNQYLWNQHYDFFIKLFKLTYLCNLTNDHYSIPYLRYSINFLYPTHLSSPFKQFFNNNNISIFFNKYSTILFWYNLKTYANYFQNKIKHSPSLRLFETRNKWNLNTLSNELINNFNVLNTKTNQLYFNNISFADLFFYTINTVELWNLPLFINNQINTTKWNRWLYKYSLLHRRFLRNSHKLTVTKQLLSSGFYTNRLFNHNTWVTHRSKELTKSIFTNLNYIYYNNTFDLNQPLMFNKPIINSVKFNSDKNKIHFFSFYENSYLWVIKRFYLFNTINTNNINSSLFTFNPFIEINQLQSELLSTNITSHFLILNKTMSLYSLNTNEFNLSEINAHYFNYNIVQLPLHSEPLYHCKDIYLLFDDEDLFNNEILDTLYWITNNTINKNNYPQIFSYIKTPIFIYPSFFFNELTILSYNNFLQTTLILMKIDYLCFKDLLLLNFFK